MKSIIFLSILAHLSLCVNIIQAIRYRRLRFSHSSLSYSFSLLVDEIKFYKYDIEERKKAALELKSMISKLQRERRQAA